MNPFRVGAFMCQLVLLFTFLPSILRAWLHRVNEQAQRIGTQSVGTVSPGTPSMIVVDDSRSKATSAAT